MVTEQQGISVEVYRSDAVWPSVALKKLVGEQVEVTEEDLQRGYEANYGPRVRCLAIVLDDLRRAQKVWEMARAAIPTADEYFGDLAAAILDRRRRASALRGEVPPIQKHGGQPKLEKEAFTLAAGRAVGHHPGGRRQVRDPALRGPHRAGPRRLRHGPRRDLRRHPREEAADRHGQVLPASSRTAPRSTTTWPAPSVRLRSATAPTRTATRPVAPQQGAVRRWTGPAFGGQRPYWYRR